MAEPFSIAVAKGRVFEEALPLLERAGYPTRAISGNSRKLLFELGASGVKLLIVRSQDVPTYVERGAADAGIVGKDVIEEQGLGLCEPLDLGISRCRLVVAAPKEAAARPGGGIGALRVATKYPNLARAHFARKGIGVDLVHLYGAVELAPVTGIADKIVDLVDSGRTLKENGLAEEELVLVSTARLIVGRASLRLKSQVACDLIARLEKALPEGERP